MGLVTGGNIFIRIGGWLVDCWVALVTRIVWLGSYSVSCIMGGWF